MNDMRRTLIWGVFIFSLFMIWNQWQVYNGKGSFLSPQPHAEQQTAQQQNPSSEIPSATTNGQPTLTASDAKDTLRGEKIIVTTDVYKAEFDTLGASLTGLDLLKFSDQQNKDQVVNLFDPAYEYIARMGVLGKDAQNSPTHNQLMHLEPGETSLAEGKDNLTVRFSSDPIGGLQVSRAFIFTRSNYEIKTQTTITNVGTEPVTPMAYYYLVRNSTELPGKSMFWRTFTGPAYYTENNKYHKVNFSEIAQNKINEQEITGSGWVAMVQHYFVSAWLLPPKAQRSYKIRSYPNGRYAIGMEETVKTLAPGESIQIDASLYAGPQEEKVLDKLAPGLDLVKDYGMFRIFAKPLFWLLYMLHSLLNNWGWSIVALVVLIKAAFYWLNARAYQSMGKMKAITPRMQELRERYKDQPQQLQQEMMRIYREEKINPLGGCLPILVQIPVFIALYWVLLSSVEMRNAPWIGWITDLSQKDPYYILPLTMTASTLFQTWLNPTPPDPTQAKMMWIMPLAFSVMFFMFPAGLVLYWVTNNILSIAQQWFINKRLGLTKK